ncbi:hypothetical protein SO802_034245 [Lithocarpus litseifolius]|uniref:Transmembrane protein n=1 Tax=Lithocarpus litseifolius TaxID=425828 RepID=A0AAW2BL25_9ROSI
MWVHRRRSSSGFALADLHLRSPSPIFDWVPIAVANLHLGSPSPIFVWVPVAVADLHLGLPLPIFIWVRRRRSLSEFQSPSPIFIWVPVTVADLHLGSKFWVIFIVLLVGFPLPPPPLCCGLLVVLVLVMVVAVVAVTVTVTVVDGRGGCSCSLIVASIQIDNNGVFIRGWRTVISEGGGLIGEAIVPLIWVVGDRWLEDEGG